MLSRHPHPSCPLTFSSGLAAAAAEWCQWWIDLKGCSVEFDKSLNNDDGNLDAQNTRTHLKFTSFWTRVHHLKDVQGQAGPRRRRTQVGVRAELARSDQKPSHFGVQEQEALPATGLRSGPRLSSLLSTFLSLELDEWSRAVGERRRTDREPGRDREEPQMHCTRVRPYLLIPPPLHFPPLSPLFHSNE